MRSQVWITLLVVMVLVIIALVFLPATYAIIIPHHIDIQTILNRLNLNYTNISDAAVYVFTILTNHGTCISFFWTR